MLASDSEVDDLALDVFGGLAAPQSYQRKHNLANRTVLLTAIGDAGVLDTRGSQSQEIVVVRDCHTTVLPSI